MFYLFWMESLNTPLQTVSWIELSTGRWLHTANHRHRQTHQIVFISAWCWQWILEFPIGSHLIQNQKNSNCKRFICFAWMVRCHWSCGWILLTEQSGVTINFRRHWKVMKLHLNNSFFIIIYMWLRGSGWWKLLGYNYRLVPMFHSTGSSSTLGPPLSGLWPRHCIISC